MLDLFAGIPATVWVLLGLTVLGPIAVAIAVQVTPAGRLGLATRLTGRAVALMALGFGIMTLVATLAVLRTGLQEIRQRHLPDVVELATELSGGHALAPDSVSFGRTLSLFRALQPEIGPAAVWGLQCRTKCLALVSDPGMATETRAWALDMIAQPTEGPHRTATLGGEMHLVVTSAIRDSVGAPEGILAVTVRAGWVAERAIRTAVVLVVLAYGLLFVTGMFTRRMLAATVARRVRDIATRLRATPTAGDSPAGDTADELAELDHVVSRHVTTTVERLREADQRTAEARALAARMEATTTLAAGVAHDFSNLMSGVMANCEILREDVGDDPEAMHTLQTVLDCAQRGGQLASQLVAFARGGKYQPAVVDLNALVTEALRLEAHSVGGAIRVEQDLATDLLRVEADAVQLTQVVSNLHRNAVEALRQAGGGVVTVRSFNVTLDGDREPAVSQLPAGPYVALVVADTGPGMSEETRARIFEPFFTTKEGGRGMGLAATYGIVTHHGGLITVDSRAGDGTTFTVLLPATSAPVPAPPPLQDRPPADDRATVLIVDDEVAVLSATGQLLRRRGYHVLTAASGAEALQLAQNSVGPIHAILLDLRMPGMSGTQAFDPLVAARPDARIIVCSGYELDNQAKGLLDRGAVAFIRKPYQVDELVAALDVALRRAP
jgi:signal transduction histidine kinase/CheY-like chemotaxis protein